MSLDRIDLLQSFLSRLLLSIKAQTYFIIFLNGIYRIMNEKLFLIGILFILVGGITALVGSLLEAKDVKFAFGGLVGFLPFFFTNDSQTSLVLVVLIAVILLIFIIPLLKLFNV